MTAGHVDAREECPGCPVTPEEVAAILAPNSVPDDRMALAVCSACDHAKAFLDMPPVVLPDGSVVPWEWPDPLPSRWREGIVGLAMDLYRQATVPFGYFASDVGLASTGADPMRRWRLHFTDDKDGWGFA